MRDSKLGLKKTKEAKQIQATTKQKGIGMDQRGKIRARRRREARSVRTISNNR